MPCSRAATVLRQAAEPWRLDWLSFGLYPDGWTRPGTSARFRVFPEPNQSRPFLRTLHLTLSAPVLETRSVTFVSNTGISKADVSAAQEVTRSVCVAAHAAADVKLIAIGSSPVEGDPSTSDTVGEPRSAGVLVNQVALDPPDAAATCVPSRGTR